MSTLAQEWVDEVKRHLLGSTPENLNRLDGAITNSATTLVYEFSSLSGITAGAVIEIDSELLYVWSVNTSTRTATVQRGYMGSTAASHSDDAIITVGPKFTGTGILTALNQDLYDLASPANGLYRIGNVNITTSAGVVGYDFNAPGYIQVHEVHYEESASSKFWTRIFNWRVVEQADATDFASGRGLIIGDTNALDGGTLHVSYKRTFSPLTATTDNIVSVTGMPVEMHDIPVLGAIGRLTITRGVRRAFDDSQGEPRRASEVNEQAMLSNATSIMAWRNRRIAAEAARLNSLYPRRLTQ